MKSQAVSDILGGDLEPHLANRNPEQAPAERATRVGTLPVSVGIIDPCLKDFVGHHFEYDRAVLQGLGRRGVRAVVLGHREMEPAVRSEPSVRPVFQRDIWCNFERLKKFKPAVRLILANLEFLRDLRRGVNAAGLRKDSILFAHMVNSHQLLGCAGYSLFFQHRSSKCVFLLRYQPWFYTGKLNTIAFRVLELVARYKTVRLGSDSRRLAFELGKLTTLPIEVLPIPHTTPAGADGPAVAIAPPLQSRKIRLVSLGNAREEKGFGEILKAIEALISTDGAEGCEFVLQANHPEAALKDRIEAFAARQIPGVILVQEALDPASYRNLLESADIVLLPYWRSVYRERTSGVFVEALTAGKPVIATERTWMSDELASHGAGILCKDQDPASLVEAIQRSVRELPELSRKATQSQAGYAAIHNPDSLVARLLNPPPALKKEDRPSRAVIVYPWGDVVTRSSGAGLRVGLFADFLATRFDQVHIIQCGIDEEVEKKNIRVESHFRGSRIVRVLKKGFTSVCLVATLGRDRDHIRFLWLHLFSYFDRKLYRKILNAARDADIIYLEYPFFAGPVAKVSRKLGIPFVLTNHDVISDAISRSPLLRLAVRALEVRGMKKADACFVVSAADQARFKSFGVESQVANSTVDCEALAVLPTRQRAHEHLAAKLGFDLSSESVILFVGSPYLPNCQAVPTVERMGRELRKRCQTRMVIAGGCASFRVTPEVVSTGRVDDQTLRSLYAVADVVVAPVGSGTGTSVKVIEAMACGKVIVGTTVAFRGLPVRPGVEALVSDDLDSYPQLIQALLSEPDRREKMGRSARQLASAFDCRKVFAAYTRQLEERVQ